MQADIHIFTGPIRSGKTTRLWQWAAGRDDVGGFLSPDREGVRHFYHLPSGKWLPFEAPAGADPASVIEIGRFRFWRESLVQAQGWLQEGLAAPKPWLVIDEVGKLELRGKGLEPAVSAVIGHYRQASNPGRLLLVVRDYLLPEVQTQYHLTGCILHREVDF
ncbi:MAG: hypothetical protein D6722_01745 [Bacteroidetes bacterium]|nr:MAG: hypothetical protein D6722_01745 [Bacteroidota bacterium]